ncbi:MAG: SgcJ/EcaC family oxidoreductase [Phycisphaeraceae bacterium]
MADDKPTVEQGEREIVSARVFNAPRERVFEAFSDPGHLSQWWGPKGFSNTIHEFDLRPGGAWRLTMHGPDGADYQNESVFVEVVKPEKVVFDHCEPIHRFQMTMTFSQENGRTKLTWRMCFESAQECARVKSLVGEANEQNFDRLEEHLASMAMTNDERAIRDLVDTWITASKTGDLQTVLDLMTDDIVFMVPGQEPFGKDAFKAASEQMKEIRIEGRSDIREIRVFGEWAYVRNYLEMTVISPDGSSPAHRSGYTLTILRKESDRQWRIARDANLLTVQ